MSFLVPESISNDILPSKNISILELLKFPLPNESAVALVNKDLAISSFFSDSPPEPLTPSLLGTLRRLPIPPRKVIQKLANDTTGEILAGRQSVVYAHIATFATTRFPLWIITFWEMALNVRLRGKEPWSNAKMWLDQKLREMKRVGREAEREKAEEVLQMLNLLPWNAPKTGLSDTESINTLSRYLGNTYTSGSNQNDVLELLRIRISSDLNLLSHFRVESTSLIPKILDAHGKQNTYCTDRAFLWIRNLGNDLVMNHQYLITDAHLRGLSNKYECEDHWVAVHIDFDKKRLLLGDPLTASPPNKLREVCLWWISQHDSSSYEVVNLSVTHQIDGHSCGPLTSNADAHAVFPNEAPLVSADRVDLLRMELFLQIGDRFLEAKILAPASEDDSHTAIADIDERNVSDVIAPSVALNIQTSSHSGITSEPPASGFMTSTPQKKQRHLVTDYFHHVSGKEKEDFERQQWEELKETTEDRRARAERDAISRKVEEREAWRIRQQRHREKVRSEKSLRGERGDEDNSSDGSESHSTKKRKRVVELDGHEPKAIAAEDSRPRRQFKEDIRLDKKDTGRKQIHKIKAAVNMNWKQPVIWAGIELAARQTGKPWSPRAIAARAAHNNPAVYGKLREQVVGRWIEKGKSEWKESVLAEVGKGNAPGGQSTRHGILGLYPDLRKKIDTRLENLRAAGVALTLLTIRGIMIACIQHEAPHLLTNLMPDGSRFKCSEAFVKKYLHQLKWSQRRATRAAQKLPQNHEKMLSDSFLREAYVIRDHGVPAELRVNTDQTQCVYQQGSKTTWTRSGASQVATVGSEEKRAFTIVPSISASGEVLPWQAIFHGSTEASCPKKGCRGWNDLNSKGFCLVPSKTSTYWSNLQTMKDLVEDIIAPHFARKREELGLEKDQQAIWRIDCWSVHKSEDFLTWMKRAHPEITIIFVPGGCTGLFQPLDVGIQRIMKLSMRRSSQRDLVAEIMEVLEQETGEENDDIASFKFNTRLATLRDRLVQWMLDAYQDISDQDFVKKAFELCRVPNTNFNLSHQSLTSSAALAKLRTLNVDDPDLYKQLTQSRVLDVGLGPDEEPFESEDAVVDESDVVPQDAIIFVMSEGSTVGAELAVNENGELGRATQGSKDDLEAEILGAIVGSEEAPVADSEATVVKKVGIVEEEPPAKRSRTGRTIRRPKQLTFLADGNYAWEMNDFDNKTEMEEVEKDEKRGKKGKRPRKKVASSSVAGTVE